MNNFGFPAIDVKATGENIIRLRKARGLSVKDLQGYFGFERPQAIYKWQWGECLPTVDNLYALSKLFNISMEEILVMANQDLIFLLFLNYKLNDSLKKRVYYLIIR